MKQKRSRNRRAHAQNPACIVKLAAARKAAFAYVNSESVTETDAAKHFTVALAIESKLYMALQDAKRRNEKLCPDEQLAVDDILSEVDDPPVYADRFKAKLFELRHELR